MLLRRFIFYGALASTLAFTVLDTSSVASLQTRNAALPSSLKLTLSSTGLPKNMPELSAAAMQVARKWRPDALNVSMEYQVVKAPNMKGAEVRDTAPTCYR